MPALDFLEGLSLPPLGIAATISLLFLLFGLIVKNIILNRLIRAVNKTPFHVDSLFLLSLKRPLSIGIVVLSLLVFEQSLVAFDLPFERYASYINTAIKILVGLAFILLIDRFALGTIENHQSKSGVLKSSSHILKGIVRGVVIGIGVLILLSTLGISITPVLASLGIGSLAVALALQPTLENFFSGVQLVMDKPIRVGDYIELESGEQGFVERIGWRSTWIKMLPNNVVIMPNSTLSQSKIINYFYPEKELSVPVEVGVHYDSDLGKVEEITLDVARHILKTHKWGVPEYDTFVVFHTFDSSSINFTVMLRTREYFNRFFIKSAFIKALHARFKEEGIVIPYPIRAINTEQESASFNQHNNDS
jgi:small-conductance mechanosensitive channel